MLIQWILNDFEGILENILNKKKIQSITGIYIRSVLTFKPFIYALFHFRFYWYTNRPTYGKNFREDLQLNLGCFKEAFRFVLCLFKIKLLVGLQVLYWYER